jgi:hypothetical protein
MTTVTEEMINTWVTLPLIKDGESEFLEPGKYIAAIQTFHNHGYNVDLGIARFTIGNDLSHTFNSERTVVFLVGGTNWYNSSRGFMVRLNLNESGAPASAGVLFKVDMTLPIVTGHFNPGNGDIVDVAGSFNNWTGSGPMDDTDGDGIYSLTIPELPVFQKIEYKYRINSEWNTSEFPDGGPNRTYRTTYWNSLNDVYNNGISLGAEIMPAQSSINIYPNPAKGSFTLEYNNNFPSDINISITDVEGNKVFREKISNVFSYQKKIDLSGYSSGLYLVNVNGQVLKLIKY